MMVLKRSLLFCLCIAAMTSCVSKKVYNDMVQSRNSVQNQLNKSRAENASIKADFSKMKEQMLASNAQKDTDISQATAALKEEQQKANGLKNDLDNMSQLYSSQKNYGSTRNQELETLKQTLADLRTKNTSIEYSLKMAQERADNSNKELVSARQSVSDQTGAARQLQQDYASQKKQLDVLNAQILENKKTLSQITSSFVELRKDMLRANSSGKPVNPNSNANVSKLAKILGQD